MGYALKPIASNYRAPSIISPPPSCAPATPITEPYFLLLFRCSSLRST